MAQNTQQDSYWGNIFQSRNDIVVAICDSKLLGKKLKHTKINKQFYGGKKIDSKIAVALLKRATIANLFGKSIIELAVKNGFITEDNVIVIDGIPHAQFVKL